MWSAPIVPVSTLTHVWINLYPPSFPSPQPSKISGSFASQQMREPPSNGDGGGGVQN
jgi:hypothetical protein